MSALPLVTLGRSGLHGSLVGLGCSRLGSTLSGVGPQAATQLVSHALERGVTLFDTADIYGQGESERLLGAALGRRRADVIVVTKAGQRFTAAQQAAALLKRPIRAVAARLPSLQRAVRAQRAHALPRDYSPEHIGRAVHGSLRRLRTDWIDLFLLHSPDAGTVKEGRCFALLDRLHEQGVIRQWGISCDDADTVEAALRVESATVLQVPLLLLQSAPRLLAEAGRRHAGLLIREVFAQNAGQPALSPAERHHRIMSARAMPGAVTLIGTTRERHLDEALDQAARHAPLPLHSP